MFAKMVSDMMIKPGSSPVFDRPADFGLDYEDVEFKTRDGVTLRGWLIKGGTDKVIIETHFGVQCSRSGYTPKGKGMIKMWKEDISFSPASQVPERAWVHGPDVRHAEPRRERSWRSPLGLLGTQ